MSSTHKGKETFGEFRVEDWYHEIEHLTFPTQFVDLSIGQATAIKNYYEATKKHANQVSDISKIYTESDQRLISDLQDSIQALMDSQEWNQNNLDQESPSFFVRLSTRSPKDSCVKTERFKLLIKELIEELGSEQEPMAVIRALNRSMLVTNASEALSLVMNSQRAYYDLFRSLLMMDEGLKKKEFADQLMPDQKIIVRLFHKTPRPELEFRVFVSNQRVTAITQYFKSCYFGDVIHRYKSRIEQSILELSKQVSEIIHEDHALDVLVEIDENNNSHELESNNTNTPIRPVRSYVIEINPFSQKTASALFRWDDKKDEMILRGKSDYEFRYVKEPCSIPESRLKLSDDVRQILQEVNPLPQQDDSISNEQTGASLHNNSTTDGTKNNQQCILQ